MEKKQILIVVVIILSFFEISARSLNKSAKPAESMIELIKEVGGNIKMILHH